jgi:ketosteroid isomerase-like protein
MWVTAFCPALVAATKGSQAICGNPSHLSRPRSLAHAAPVVRCNHAGNKHAGGELPPDDHGPGRPSEGLGRPLPAPEQEVVDALVKFYEAVQASDMDAMRDVWLPASDAISVAHPFRGLAVGRDQVLATWGAMFALGRVVDVDVEIVRVEVSTNMAWCVAIQHLTTKRANETIGGKRISTNIFQMWKGHWKMVYHGAAPVLLEDASEAPDDPDGASGGRTGV